jgi:hypothetical protein
MTTHLSARSLSRNRKPDAEAAIDGGTFVIPASAGLSENSPSARLTVCDEAGNVL